MYNVIMHVCSENIIFFGLHRKDGILIIYLLTGQTITTGKINLYKFNATFLFKLCMCIFALHFLYKNMTFFII